jgi:outer membrane protein, multidrug efflux system
MAAGRPSRLAIAGIGLLLLLPGGCVSLPEVVDPGIALAIRFDHADARPAADLSRWWGRFGSPALSQLVDQADLSNLDIAAAAARIMAAEAQARIAGAVLVPGLSLSGDAARSQGSGTLSRSGGAQAVAPRNTFSGVLATSYELDLWGRNRDLLTAAQASVAATVLAREALRLSTRASLINAWFLHATARDRLGLAAENLRNAERVLAIIRERLRAGTATALDIAQQESLVASQRAALPDLRQASETSRTTIALLLGRPPERLAVVTPSLKALRVPGVAPGQPASLLLRRPDLRGAEADLLAAEANLAAARKALLPTIQLTGQGGVQSAMLKNLLRPESAIWSLAAGLTQPIFDGGRLTAEVDLAAARKQELLENYRKAIVSALVDVENALVAVRESAAREAALGVVVARAQEAFRLSEERLKLGTIDLQTLIGIQNTLFQAQDSLIQSRLQRLQASVSLFQALGGDFVNTPQATIMVAPQSRAGASE